LRNKLLPVALLACVLGVGGWLYSRKSSPPEVSFTRVRRELLVSTLTTNGKVEPLEWSSVHTERGGLVERVLVERGRTVSRGAVLAELSNREAAAELAAAEARVEQAKAELEVAKRGGRAAERAEIESSLKRARLDRENARTNHEALQRLAAQEAATGQEVAAARDQMAKAELQIQAFEARRAALVGREDRQVAQARLRDAEAAAQLARQRRSLGSIRAPMNGMVYQLTARPGAFLNPGDAVASVGRLDKVKVVVYVDEPELGRVAEGMPVAISWDAKPGQRWQGTVEKIPTEIVALGTRQVGEVVCVIENPQLELLPGTNINAEIRSRVVENALTIPKETLRREGSDIGVLVLHAGLVRWRKVNLGVSSVTRAQVSEGLSDGDAVALPTERALRDGDAVRPIYQ
jgi:HlyD family secretion protein